MRNLVEFIWRNYFFFLFLILETLCIYLVVQNNKYQRTSFINSSNAASAKVLATAENIQQYFYLKDVNEKLALENAEFHNRDLSSFSMLVTDHFTIKDTVYRQQYTYTSAKVVNNSTNRRDNYLTLNKGSDQGIAEKMAVISSTGVVGTVKDVSKNFCTVVSVLHSDFNVSAKIKKDGSFGPLTWSGEDYSIATLSDIPTHVRMKAGDTIVTSQYSKRFPENVMIGVVDSYYQEPLKPFYTVKVKLSTDFKKLTYVYIVQNKLRDEQEALEKKSGIESKD